MTHPPEQVDILITGADIVTFDASATVIMDGAIAVKGNKILWVGKRSEAGAYRGATTIDGSGKIAMPGLIDSHYHTAQQFLRGKLFAMGRIRKLKVPPWKNYYLPWESGLDPDDIHISGLWGYICMIRSGTTFLWNPAARTRTRWDRRPRKPAFAAASRCRPWMTTPPCPTTCA